MRYFLLAVIVVASGFLCGGCQPAKVQPSLSMQDEFVILGEDIRRPGVYSFKGRQVTAKMAVAAAGTLAPLPWPCEGVLIRNIDQPDQQMIPVHIERIFQGHETDIVIQSGDIFVIGPIKEDILIPDIREKAKAFIAAHMAKKKVGGP